MDIYVGFMFLGFWVICMVSSSNGIKWPQDSSQVPRSLSWRVYSHHRSVWVAVKVKKLKNRPNNAFWKTSNSLWTGTTLGRGSGIHNSLWTNAKRVVTQQIVVKKVTMRSMPWTAKDGFFTSFFFSLLFGTFFFTYFLVCLGI